MGELISNNIPVIIDTSTPNEAPTDVLEWIDYPGVEKRSGVYTYESPIGEILFVNPKAKARYIRRECKDLMDSVNILSEWYASTGRIPPYDDAFDFMYSITNFSIDTHIRDSVVSHEYSHHVLREKDLRTLSPETASLKWDLIRSEEDSFPLENYCLRTLVELDSLIDELPDIQEIINYGRSSKANLMYSNRIYTMLRQRTVSFLHYALNDIGFRNSLGDLSRMEEHEAAFLIALFPDSLAYSTVSDSWQIQLSYFGVDQFGFAKDTREILIDHIIPRIVWAIKNPLQFTRELNQKLNHDLIYFILNYNLKSKLESYYHLLFINQPESSTLSQVKNTISDLDEWIGHQNIELPSNE